MRYIFGGWIIDISVTIFGRWIKVMTIFGGFIYCKMDYFWEVDISDVYFWSIYIAHEDVEEGREPDTSGSEI